MPLYQELESFEKRILSFQVTVDSPKSGFLLAGGVEYDSGFQTGFAFSGSEGYIFDNAGLFFGGYESGIPFDITMHFFQEDRYSYFFNNVLVANNRTGGYISDIEFDKRGSSTLSIISEGSNEGLSVFCSLKDSGGYTLYDNANVLLFSSDDCSS